jgi:hypothetical protein
VLSPLKNGLKGRSHFVLPRPLRFPKPFRAAILNLLTVDPNYSLQRYPLHYSESLIRNFVSTTDTLIFHMLQCANQWTRIIGGANLRSHQLTH